MNLILLFMWAIKNCYLFFSPVLFLNKTELECVDSQGLPVVGALSESKSPIFNMGVHAALVYNKRTAVKSLWLLLLLDVVFSDWSVALDFTYEI